MFSHIVRVLSRHTTLLGYANYDDLTNRIKIAGTKNEETHHLWEDDVADSFALSLDRPSSAPRRTLVGVDRVLTPEVTRSVKTISAIRS